MGRKQKKKSSKPKKFTKSALGKILEETPILDEDKLTTQANRDETMAKDRFARMYGTFKVESKVEANPDSPRNENPPGYINWPDRHSKFYLDTEASIDRPLVSKAYVDGQPSEPPEPSEPSESPSEDSPTELYGGNAVYTLADTSQPVQWHDENDQVEPDPDHLASVRAFESFEYKEMPDGKIEVTAMGDTEPQWTEPFDSLRAKILSQYFSECSMEARHHMTSFFDRPMDGYWHEMTLEEADRFIEYCRDNLEPNNQGRCEDFWGEI